MKDDNWNDVGEKPCMFTLLDFKKQFFIENLIRAKLNYRLCLVIVLENDSVMAFTSEVYNLNLALVLQSILFWWQCTIYYPNKQSTLHVLYITEKSQVQWMYYPSSLQT